MNLTTLILDQFERETAPTRRVLERVPEANNDWKPHSKSMPLGVLAHLVATMPSWIAMMVNLDELDITPKPGDNTPRTFESTQALLDAFDKVSDEARSVLVATTEEFLQTPWRLLAGGKVQMEGPRYRFILDNFLHLAHHRGQLSVYLRLNEAFVPSIYGPTADDKTFK